MNGSHQMFSYTKSLLGVGKSAFSRFENVNQGSKNHFRRSGYRFQMSKISKLCTVFNQLDRLQLAETIIPNIVTLLNFEQPENIAL